MKASVLVSHPFGNANVRHATQAFSEAKTLSGFRTCINWQENSPFASLLPSGIRRQLSRRTFPPSVAANTRSRPFRELCRLTADRLDWKSLTAHETGPFSVDAVTQDLDSAVSREILHGKNLPSAVYAYEDGALLTFEAAKKRGLTCLYDLPIGYWREARAIQSEEAELQPEWAATLTAMIDSPGKLERKNRELELADAIYVASHFTASTLTKNLPAPKPIHIIPYGCPPPQNEPSAPHAGPLRVLFAGSLGQRKGTSYLLSAVDQLGPAVSLTLLGSRPSAKCNPLDLALTKHRWIPSLPHALVLEEMRNHDVLVFPSLFEGFGLVLLEALSQGIPVITTSHTGGPDVLTDGEDGWIVPIRDSAAIAQKLLFLAQNRDALQEMKSAALQKARVITWEKYRVALSSSVLQTLS